MSNSQNERYLEGMLDEFRDAQRGETRVQILRELRDQGFGDKVGNLLILWMNERAAYLEEHDRTEDDVKRTEFGSEYVETVVEVEGADGPELMPVFIPIHLDIQKWKEVLEKSSDTAAT